MDTFAHAFWSFIIFHTQEYVWLAVLFGMLPDLLSWTIYLVRNFIVNRKLRPPKISKVPKWVFTLYGITHSVFVMGTGFLLVFFIFGTLPLFLLAWTIHVLIDIPTHRRDFLPTPFLWPISKYAFPGISWGTKKFMTVNYSLISLSLILIFLF